MSAALATREQTQRPVVGAVSNGDLGVCAENLAGRAAECGIPL